MHILRLTAAMAIVTTMASAQPHETGPARIADRDFGRVSPEGVTAFNDIALARRAIFDGRTDEAMRLVSEAEVSIHKVRTEDTLFMNSGNFTNKAPAIEASTSPMPRMAVPAIAWVPIDSELALGETFVATPESSAAVANARKRLEQGEGAKSLAMIRFAGIDVDYTVSVAPLVVSVIDIDRAKGMLAANDFYGASQALRQAEDGVRHKEFDDVGDVRNQATASIAKAH